MDFELLSKAYKSTKFNIVFVNEISNSNFKKFPRLRFFYPSPPPPINFVHGFHMYYIDNIGHVAASPGPLACPSLSALPKKCLNLILTIH